MNSFSSFRIKVIAALFSLFSIWILLLYQLSISWEINEQYSHGFLVPILCFFLLLQASQPKNFDHKIDDSKQVKLCFLVGIPILLLIAPIWVIRGANSDWRLLNVVLFILIFMISLLHLSFGPGKIHGLKKFIFPLLFFLVAVPWPLATDLRLTQWLQEMVSKMIVDILLLMEHEAKLMGTVIDVGVFGQLGVDQACSGINGLQASIVVSLFLGSYYGFTPLNRLLICISGLLISLLFNLFRAFVLAYVKIKGKGEWLDNPFWSYQSFSLPTLHDAAGYLETGLIFISILLLAKMTKKNNLRNQTEFNVYNWNNFKICPPLAFSIFSICLVIGTVLGTEYHFKNNEKEMEVLPMLSLNINDKDAVVFENEISRQIAAQLHFEEAKSIQWQDRFRAKWNPYGDLEINQNNEYWQAFQATWDSGGACIAVLSTHSPESCLPLTGLTQISPLAGEGPVLVTVNINDRKILFETYEFMRNYRKLFVFRCFWPGKLTPGQPNLFPMGGYNFDGRIRSAIDGRRNVGGTMLALALANVESQQTALTKLQILAKHHLTLSTNSYQ